MSLETSSQIFVVIMAIGLLAALYFLIKDRVEILRSIKPNSWSEFFGLQRAHHDFFHIRYILVRFIVNIFMLLIWVPFWILDKLFRLNIFEENTST